MAHKRMEKLKDLMNMETVHVAWDFLKENGLKALILNRSVIDPSKAGAVLDDLMEANKDYWYLT